MIKHHIALTTTGTCKKELQPSLHHQVSEQANLNIYATKHLGNVAQWKHKEG